MRPAKVPTSAPRPVAVARGSKSGATKLLGRLPSPIGPVLAGIPPRILLGGMGLVAAAVVIVIFASAGSNDVAATATTPPTEAAPVATIGCPTPTSPLATPDLVVRALDGVETHLAGFASPDAAVNLDGPWPAELGSIEASLELGSTLRLVSPGPCIAEWRAVAAPLPTTTGKPWRPDAVETQQLGWQHADRVGWQPTFKLPPRGEWIVRLTVWYRDDAGARAPTPAPAASSTDDVVAAGDWVVERYFHVVVEARGSSE